MIDSRPDVLNHNIETVVELQRAVRPSAGYARSLSVLARAKAAGLTTKSGMIVGIGESIAQVHRTLIDLAAVGVDIVTIGQYLRPTTHHLADPTLVGALRVRRAETIRRTTARTAPRRSEPTDPIESSRRRAARAVTPTRRCVAGLDRRPDGPVEPDRCDQQPQQMRPDQRPSVRRSPSPDVATSHADLVTGEGQPILSAHHGQHLRADRQRQPVSQDERRECDGIHQLLR